MGNWSRQSVELVNVRMAADQAYCVPAELVETRESGQALVRFAAGNLRLVRIDLLAAATEQDREEFEAGQTRWSD